MSYSAKIFWDQVISSNKVNKVGISQQLCLTGIQYKVTESQVTESWPKKQFFFWKRVLVFWRLLHFEGKYLQNFSKVKFWRLKSKFVFSFVFSFLFNFIFLPKNVTPWCEGVDTFTPITLELKPFQYKYYQQVFNLQVIQSTRRWNPKRNVF